MSKEEIKALRKKLKLNTKAFGELFPVSSRAVESWEQGIRNPSKVCKCRLKVIKEGKEGCVNQKVN